MDSVQRSEDSVACALMGAEFRQHMAEFNRSCDDGSLDVGLFGAGVDTWVIKDVSVDDGTAVVLTHVVTDSVDAEEYSLILRLDLVDDDWLVTSST